MNVLLVQRNEYSINDNGWNVLDKFCTKVAHKSIKCSLNCNMVLSVKQGDSGGPFACFDDDWDPILVGE